MRGVVGVGVPLFCALLGVVLLLLLVRLEGRGVEVVVGPVDDRLDCGFDLAEWRLPVDSEATRFYLTACILMPDSVIVEIRKIRYLSESNAFVDIHVHFVGLMAPMTWVQRITTIPT